MTSTAFQDPSIKDPFDVRICSRNERYMECKECEVDCNEKVSNMMKFDLAKFKHSSKYQKRKHAVTNFLTLRDTA